jgi:glucosamine-6-phosphate deaminase
LQRLDRRSGSSIIAALAPAPVRLERYSKAEDVARRGADLVAEVVAGKPDAVLALPAGATPVPLYRELERRQEAGTLDLSRAELFQLDELVGVPPDDERSFHAFLERHFARCRGPGREKLRLHLLDGGARDPEGEIARHARLLAELGGADLALLGLGRNGHVAFNEPGSRPADAARVVELCPASTAALGSRSDGKARAMTLGLAEIAASRRIALLVTGKSKATILCTLLRDAPSSACPASLLAGHRDVRVLADAEACALLDA